MINSSLLSSDDPDENDSWGDQSRVVGPSSGSLLLLFACASLSPSTSSLERVLCVSVVFSSRSVSALAVEYVPRWTVQADAISRRITQKLQNPTNIQRIPDMTESIPVQPTRQLCASVHSEEASPPPWSVSSELELHRLIR